MEKLMQNPPYEDHVGKYVEVSGTSSSEMGIYRGKTENGDLVLQPCIVRVRREENNGKTKSFFRLEDRAAYICHSAIMAFVPALEEYVNSIIKAGRISS